jgi:hypothetical protein
LADAAVREKMQAMAQRRVLSWVVVGLIVAVAAVATPFILKKLRG